MSELGTVIWKEWRELRAQSGELGPKTTAVLTVILLAIVGAIAVAAGPFIVRTPLLLMMGYVPIAGVIGVICDAFAGERERHTLETLLASSIRSEALLMGKILLPVIYGCSGTFLLTAIVILGANARTITQPWILPTLPIVLALTILTPLVLLFFASLGVLVSLRAATVKQAQSRLVLVFMALFVGMAMLSLLPKHAASSETIRFIVSARGQLIVVGVWIAIFGALDVALVLLAYARFRRDQLIEIR